MYVYICIYIIYIYISDGFCGATSLGTYVARQVVNRPFLGTQATKTDKTTRAVKQHHAYLLSQLHELLKVLPVARTFGYFMGIT